MLRKLHLLVTFLLAVSFYGHSEKQMVLNFTNGETKSVNLQEIKNITLSNGALVLNSTNGTSSTTTISTLSKITFAGDFSAIENIASAAPAISLQGDMLAVDELSGKKPLQVFSTVGVLVLTAEIDGNGTVSIAGLPAGVYFAKIESFTFKFIKR